MQRSIDRDYDINYHKRAFWKSMEDLEMHAKGMSDVGYYPGDELWQAECTIGALSVQLAPT